MVDDTTATDPIELAAELTIAWLSNPNHKAEAGDVGGVLRQMHEAVKSLAGLGEPETPAAEEFTPAVSVRKSLASKDYLVSLIDGKAYKSLKRHLARHGLTPESYRARYGLKSDYPMVSENYSQARRDMAKKLGLGRKPKAATAASKPAAKAGARPAARRGRPKKAN